MFAGYLKNWLVSACNHYTDDKQTSWGCGPVGAMCAVVVLMKYGRILVLEAMIVGGTAGTTGFWGRSQQISRRLLLMGAM